MLDDEWEALQAREETLALVATQEAEEVEEVCIPQIIPVDSASGDGDDYEDEECEDDEDCEWEEECEDEEDCEWEDEEEEEDWEDEEEEEEDWRRRRLKKK